MVRRQAAFPLAVDVAGGGSVVWRPERSTDGFSLRPDSQGDVEAEISNRKLGEGRRGVRDPA